MLVLCFSQEGDTTRYTNENINSTNCANKMYEKSIVKLRAQRPKISPGQGFQPFRRLQRDEGFPLYSYQIR